MQSVRAARRKAQSDMNVVHNRTYTSRTAKRRHVIVTPKAGPKVTHAIRDEASLLTDIVVAVVRGMGQLASLGQPRRRSRLKTDAESLHGDWVKIGGDMRTAIEKVKHGETAA